MANVGEAGRANATIRGYILRMLVKGRQYSLMVRRSSNDLVKDELEQAYPDLVTEADGRIGYQPKQYWGSMGPWIYFSIDDGAVSEITMSFYYEKP